MPSRHKYIKSNALSNWRQLFWLCIFLFSIFTAPAVRAQVSSIQEYSFSTGVDPTAWLTLSAPQIITNTHVDDNAYGPFNIGFPFSFCGTEYSQFSVSSNGCLKLGSTLCSASPYSTPFSSSNVNSNNPKIIGIGRDLSIGSGGYIRYQTLGTAPNRIFVCEYKLSHTSSSYTASVMWQVQLYESNGEVRIVYNSSPSSIPSSYQIGIANNGTDVITVNPSTHTLSTGSSSATYSIWPGQWHYYSFIPPLTECGIITRLSVSATGTNSAFVQWSVRNASPSTQVVLQYDDDPNFGSPQSVTVTGNPPYALTGLQPNTSYYLRASINCNEGVTEGTSEIRFNTLPQECAQYSSTPNTISIGTGTNSDNYLWGYSYYKYSFSEQIYRQSELGASSTLTGMSVQVKNADRPRSVSIYLGHTSENSVNSWILPSDLTLVWNGTTQYTANSWNDITFLTPFLYNGIDNLLLVIIDHTGSYQSSPYNSMYVHNNTGYYSRYIYSDGTSYNVNFTPTSDGTSSSYRVNVRWHSLECLSQVNCETPAILVTDITDHEAVVQWSAVNTTNYRIYLGTDNTTPTLLTTTTGTTYTLTGLDGDTRYKIYVLPDCATGFPIWGGSTEFRTDCDEIAGRCITYDDLNSCRVECRHGNFDNPDSEIGVVNHGPSSSSSCHTIHNNPLERDPRTGSQLYTVPDGYATSVRLGNWETGYGAESIRYRYKVDTTESDLLILKYAAVLQDPNHTAIEQPRFTFRVTDDNGVDLDAACYSADFIANSNLGWNSYGSVLWKDWTTVGVSLTPFHGQTIYIKLTTYDCNQGGHYGYAYFVIDCGNKQLTSSSCGDTEENTYTAPSGFNYRWYNDNAPDITLSTEQSYHVTAAGTYHCQLSFVGASNASCSSVLTAISGSRYPFSRFNYTVVDTVDCSVEIRFYNNSVITRDLEHNQLTNYPCESYLWIFDDGTTSTDINPYHTLSEGTHEVKLVAMLSNGTCSDTSTVSIHIDGLCEPIIGYDERTICEHELPYEWNGVQFLSEGTQEVVLQTASHADSTVVMTLTVLQPINTAVNDTACETFTWNGTAYTLSGSYTHSHPDANHCIQVDTLHLTINYNTSGIDERTACDSLRWHGNLYTASTTTPTHHSTNAARCDSTTTLHLTINNHLYAIDEHNVCDSLVWHGSTYHASTDSPTYNSVSAAGCDSTTTLHLTVRHSTSGIDEQDVCDSHTWHGTTYTASTLTPTHLSTNAAGCDSVTTLHLTVRHSTHGVDIRTVCDSLRWHDSLYLMSTNTPTHLSTNAADCDSTTTLHLTVNNHIYAVDAHNVCDSLVWHGSTYHASTDSPTYNSVSAAGCDSTTTLHLTVRYSTSGIDEQDVCDSYTWNGTTHTTSTLTPTHHSLNAAGCDSVTTLHLTVRYSTSGIDEQDVCDSYTWHGTTYTASTLTPTHHSTNAVGCDSVTTLHLTVRHSTHGVDIRTVCDSLRWHDSLYLVSTNTPTHLSTNAAGCDSTTTLHLTVNNHIYAVDEHNVCDSLTWHGTTYHASTNNPTHNSTSAAGCDSTTTLHLTVRYSSSGIDEQHVCDALTWHGTTYTESTNTPVYHSINAAGCDSVVTLHLTVYHSATGDTTATACDRFTWHHTGETYTHDTTLNFQLSTLNSEGCDSTVTLHLTIYTSYDIHHNDTICEGGSIRFAGEDYSERGDYTIHLQSCHSCDSTVTMHLTVRQKPQVEIVAEYGCPTETWKLLAITDGERYTWSTEPRNQQLVGHEHDTIIRIHVEDSTLLTLTADYATGVSCPSFDQVTLSPIVKVTAQIECRPEVLREDNPEILAIDKSRGSNNRDWYVDDLAWGNTPTISYTIDKSTNELTFTLIAYNDHCADTAKRTLYSTNESLFTPNVFTPSLSTNSTFRIQGTGILEFHITIYTREGQLVFSSNDIDSEWDGTHNGEPCPQANYVYHIRYRGRSMPDGWQTATGSVLLLR